MRWQRCPQLLALLLASAFLDVQAEAQGDGTTCVPGQLLVTSAATGSVLLIDPQTGTSSTVLTGLGLPDSIAIDATGTRAYVGSPPPGRLWQLDLQAGGTSVVVDSIFLWRPRGVALDASGTTAYVVDDLNDALWTVDLASGSRLQLASGLVGPQDVVIDAAEQRAFVVGYDSDAIWSVDLSSGAMLPLVQGLSHPTAIDIDRSGTTLYVVEAYYPVRLVRVDVATGAVTQLTAGLDLDSAAVAVDEERKTAYVASLWADRVWAVSLETGAKSVVATGIDGPSGIAVCPVADQDADGVLDDADLCPDTAIPESAPRRPLLRNHWALLDEDLVFDTARPSPGRGFTTDDTGGCSCEQIIDATLPGVDATYGCSTALMRTWTAAIGLCQP